MNKRIGPFPTNGASKAACLLGLVCPVLLRCCGTHTPSLPTAVLSVESWMQAGASACFVMLERNGSKAQASSNDLRALMRGESATLLCRCFGGSAFASLRTQFTKGRALPTCFACVRPASSYSTLLPTPKLSVPKSTTRTASTANPSRR